MSSDIFTFDVTVVRDEPSFDRACEQAKKLAGEEVEKQIDVHKEKTGEWVSQDSVTITFRSYQEEVNYRFESTYMYVFSVAVRLS